MLVQLEGRKLPRSGKYLFKKFLPETSRASYNFERMLDCKVTDISSRAQVHRHDHVQEFSLSIIFPNRSNNTWKVYSSCF